MVKQTNSPLQPRQIVYLEYEDRRLYGEVIQVISSRQRCWVRPWLLVISSPGEPQTVYNLHESVDLLWHTSEFRLALDAELIPLLAQQDSCDCRGSASAESGDRGFQQTRQQLHYFLNQLWQRTSVKQ
ncbi:MAG: hypothetical protein SAJ37_02835 [Oscillatoria sp. PMC 1068.18]|nr:hypothetical protein [Oscillatoria sp. PMC 1076.18]MEC4987659.1 hypothetical protein [Oscillatoria sp. PMC 1068.18]